MNEEPGFGKNYILALALSMVVLMAYPMILKFFYPEYGKKPEVVETQDSQNTQSALKEEFVSNDPLQASTDLDRETLSLGQVDAPTIIPYENQWYQVEFSTLGGTLKRLYFKDNAHHDHLQGLNDSVMFEHEAIQPGMMGMRFTNDALDLSRIPFKLTRKDRGRYEFTYERPGEYRVVKRFLFADEGPSFQMDIEIENLSGREQHFPIELLYGLHYGLESPHDARFIEAIVNQNQKIKRGSEGKLRKKGFEVEGAASWAGFIKKYYALLVQPQSEVLRQSFESDGKAELSASMQLAPISVLAGQSARESIFVYAGTQQRGILKSFDRGFESLLARGMIGTFKVWLLIGLEFFYKYTGNYGWAIILLTLLIKGAFTPLTHMSMENMKKMQAIAPKQKAIQERHKSDPQKAQQEIMKLFKRNKVNPAAGCLPMLLQIPIFFAFYQALSEAIELKGAPFILWITDLSQPDRLLSVPVQFSIFGWEINELALNILPLLMIASMVLQQKLTPTVSASPEQAKIMQWMPIFMGFIFYGMPSGLNLYWFISTVLSVIHQGFIKRIVVVLHHEDREDAD